MVLAGVARFPRAVRVADAVEDLVAGLCHGDDRGHFISVTGVGARHPARLDRNLVHLEAKNGAMAAWLALGARKILLRQEDWRSKTLLMSRIDDGKLKIVSADFQYSRRLKVYIGLRSV